MAIPTVFQPVRPQDFTITPITVHKRYVIQRTDLYSGSLPVTSSGYKVWTAVYTNERLKLGTPSQNNYPTNSFDGTYQHIIWKSIDAQYYRFPHDSYATLEHSNGRFTHKFLNYSASIIVCPQQDFGEGILPGSVTFDNDTHNIHLQDDVNGNLYSINDSTASYSDPTGIVARWQFNDEFKNFKNISPDPSGYLATEIGSGLHNYKSNNFSPDTPSIYKNVQFVNNTSTYYGTSIRFGSGLSSYMFTDHRDEFNPTGDFSISFWFNAYSLASAIDILNKSNVVRTNELGSGWKENANGTKYYTEHYTSSLKNEPTPVYPYKFRYDVSTEELTYYRSNGINTISLSTTISPEDVFKHVCVVKSGSLLTLYKDGVSAGTTSDLSDIPYNKHGIIFGSSDTNTTSSGDYMLSEIRLYDYGLPSNQVATLASPDQSSIQSQVVGNVFYKRGMIVISPINPSFLLATDPTSTWTLKYRNTHTIYQWETIVRIPKGSFNVSQNPTALQNPYTDLLKNEFTGSNPNVDLFPMCTSIGLYNDQKELMVVGKLSQPLKMRNDTDMNIIIKFDV